MMRVLFVIFAMVFGGMILGTSAASGEPFSVRHIAEGDENIEIDVKAQFDRDRRVNLSDVIIASENGEVKLIGTVLTEYEKAHAERLAGKVSGVKQVINLIQVIEPRHPDIALAKKVRSDILQNPSLQITKLQVGVDQKHVHLRGISTDPEIRKMAEQMVSKMPGVKGVENGILVQGKH